MHASLQMSRLVELPSTVQGVATAAANGSFQDFQRLRQIIFVEKSHGAEAVLPVIYRCLDPQKIPTIDEPAPRRAVSVAGLALRTLFIVIVPAGAGSDLWPRAWAWFQFLDTHRPNLTEMKRVLVKCACRLRLEERRAILNATQGFYTIVGRLWASLADGTDVELDTLRYVSALLTTMDISNLEELMEGVGGSFKSLAALAVRHLDLPKDAPITELRLELLRDVLIFAARVAEAADDGDGPPNSARTLIEDLVLAGYSPLMQTLRTLSLATDPHPAWAIDSCFSFLLALFNVHKMHGVLPAAIHLGLIADILLCAHRYSPLTQKLRANLMFILRHLCQCTVYAEILGTIDDRMLETLATVINVTELANSSIWEWLKNFMELVDDRNTILDQMVPRKTCDNLACNKKGVKDEFRMCSKCKHSYYCSKECQSADWGAGQHKAACVAYRSGEHSLTQRRHLTTRDRDFMRALMDHDWRKSKGEIYKQTVECMKAHPDAGCFTVFDYVSGPFSAKVYSLAEESSVLETLRKAGSEWELTVARAARSQGRITIHVMRAYEGKSGRYWVLPLRSTTGEVHERLKRIAADAVAGVNVPDFSTLDISAWDVDAMH